MSIKKSDIRSKLSDDEYGFLLSRVYDKYNDFSNYIFLFLIESDEIPIDFFDEYIDILYEYSEYTERKDRRDCALDILDKLNVIRDEYFFVEPKNVQEEEQSDVTDTNTQEQEEEPQEQEREEQATYDLKSTFSDDEYGFLLSRVFDKFEDTQNDLYLKVISNYGILIDDIEQLQSIIRDYLKVTSINDHRYLMGTAILQKLFDLLRSEDTRNQEREEPASDSDLNLKIRYTVTVYYADGHSNHRSFIGCADGLVFNFHQNKLNLDAPERGYRSVFNMFNFPEPEKIVACDLSYELFEDLSF